MLRVDGKKMPLALFRQIPRADCLTSEYAFDESLKPCGQVANLRAHVPVDQGNDRAKERGYSKVMYVVLINPV